MYFHRIAHCKAIYDYQSINPSGPSKLLSPTNMSVYNLNEVRNVLVLFYTDEKKTEKLFFKTGPIFKCPLEVSKYKKAVIYGVPY